METSRHPTKDKKSICLRARTRDLPRRSHHVDWEEHKDHSLPHARPSIVAVHTERTEELDSFSR